MAIILERRADYWGAWFYGVERMPEDVELPLPFAPSATLAMVAADIRKRFPGSPVLYRTTLGTLTHVGC